MTGKRETATPEFSVWELRGWGEPVTNSSLRWQLLVKTWDWPP